MRADFRAFFDNANADLSASNHSLLLKPYRRCQSGRARANDDNVILH